MNAAPGRNIGISAVEALFTDCQSALLRYAASLTGDADAARDVVQDAFARLIERGDTAHGGERTRAWLFAVCRNRALDHRREGRRISTLPLAHDSSDPRPAPAEDVERGEDLDVMLRAIGALPTSQQEVVRLKFQAGLSYREIAEVTSRSVGNVGFLLHAALRALREELR